MLQSIEFDPLLPINQRRKEIAKSIQENQVTILCGETGSGKTTQLPKICLSIGRGEKLRIGHTQPRRIAARAVATRIAEELKSTLGGLVGFKIRFNDQSQKSSRIKLMTDGILLAETQSDPLLRQYDTIIIDEAHERSLNIDFLLGYLRQILPKRPDLKLIITSATIDPERFSRHFNDAPILEVSGRTYPVELRYRPLEVVEGGEQRNQRQDRTQQLHQSILEAVHELGREGAGDILLFLSGEREIREVGEFLTKAKLPQTELLPLFSRLSAKEQNRIFANHSGRHIILSTNVAETSLTVPGIRYVIDTGTARISRYSHRTGIQRLPIEKISQAAADQRKGRCGRVSDGICIRLYSEEDFISRSPFTDPEILRTHLAPVILQMAALKLGQPDQFPFIDPPDLRLIRDGFRTLHELGAVRKNHTITPLGKQVARFPVDPQIARMLLAAERESCLQEMLIIAAALTIQDPRERPLDAQQAADQKHEPFVNEQSDFLFFLNLWNFYQEQKQKLSNSQLRKLCKTNFLSWMRMREWREVHTQLTQLTREMRLKINNQPADYGMIHRALLAGLLSHIATVSSEKHLYNAARGVQMKIWPGSGQFRSNPKWIVAAEKVETSQLYARTVARIDPQWLERIGKHLLKRSYAEPHWEKRRGQVAAFETVTLYGLAIVARRRTNFGPIDPLESRKIFIRFALVEGELNTQGNFLNRNRKQIEAVESLEAKSRRRDILADDETLYDFYDQLIPEGVYSGPTFEKWRKQAEQETPSILYLTEETLMQHGAEEVRDGNQFPDHLTVGRAKLPLSYHFEPESESDGVTLTLPAELLAQMQAETFEWLVPGLLRERVVAMLRALPKSWRRNFVPAPDFADALLPSLKPETGALGAQLSAHLRQMTGVTLPEGIWKTVTLPDHLTMRFQVLAVDGTIQQSGRALRQLQESTPATPTATRPASSRQQTSPPPAHPLERQQITQWDFGTLPESVEVERHGIVITLHPALVSSARKGGETLSLQLLETPEQAHEQNIRGVTTLFLQEQQTTLQKTVKEQIDQQKLCLHYLSIGRCETLLQELLRVTVQQLLFQQPEIPREREEYQHRCQQVERLLAAQLQKNGKLVGEILKRYHTLSRQLKGSLSPAHLMTYSKIKSHLESLVYPHFLQQTPQVWLEELPRYLQAIEKRLDKLSHNPQNDRQRAQQIAPFWDPLEKRINDHSSAEFIEFRWLLEEFRVSLFAQELGTKKPVSADRLKKLWRKL
jgi:ATP-dependent helicase HrpA